MKNFKVVDYKTKDELGDFLNVQKDRGVTFVWYFCAKDGIIKSAYLEDIELKEENDFETN